MSTSGQFENMICEAIETLVDRAVEKANYDKTIQASIVEQVDATIGKYKVKYQDSTFFAYAADVNANYSKGTNVYVLVPSNDMEKDKTIIGAVEKLGTDYIPTVPEKNKYDEIGSNFIEIPHDEIGVCSYYKTDGFSFLDPTVLNPKAEEEKDYFLIYDSDRAINDISLIAADQIEKYMRDSSYLICGATFKTNLESRQIQDTSGTYGIEFELTFKSGEEEINKVYRIDNNDMEGYPYHYEKGSAQRVYFPIDGKSFIKINRIQLFCAKFPNIDTTKTQDDIFALNLLLQGANKISEEDLNGCYLTLTTPQGEFLGTDGKSEISLVANLRVKGQNVGSDQNVSYYWFRENPKITRESDLFHLYGGLGWECLNKKTTSVINSDGVESTITDFTSLGNTFWIKKEDIKSKYANYKCVAVYNENSFSAEKVIQNNDFDYILELVTDSGKTSFNGFGTPIITCNIYNKQGELLTSLTDFTFSWAQVNSNGQFTSLSEQSNKITVNMNQILTFATYKCAVYKDNSIYVGSSSITLKNEEAQELDLYSLVINNGSKVFKYNEAGVSPASSRLDNPMIISELSFTLYDPEGKEDTSFDSNVWYFPIENTMLKLNYGEETPPVDDEDSPKYYVITNPKDGKISYSIADLYDPAKTNNTIRLSVKVGDTTYTETTTFLFVREGDSGTNGTDYILRILPNVSEKNEEDPLIPILTRNKTDNSYFWNYTLKTAGEALKLQIWKSEALIYEGTDSGDIALMDEKVEGESAAPNATLNWVNLIHKYSSELQDISYINLNGNSGKALFTGNFSNETDPANIIQARVSCDGAFFSATLPIITAEIPSGDYRIKLKDGSGFTSVIYSADGMFPQYNKNIPFEIIIEKKNDKGEWEQKFDNSEKFKYNWSIRGKVNGKDVSSDYLKNSLKTTKTDNQYWTVPVERCSAECLSVAVYCKILNEDDSTFGWIHIPIHFMLNRYGQAALNGWDGNSVDINEEGGYILSPQVGAGRKETDNSFTGIFMGEVKEYKDNSEISHNGILGYHHGVKSLFINAEDGSAIFGKVSIPKGGTYYEGGQIILDPSHKEAILYSANFFEASAYGDDGKADIDGARSGKGLLINLSKPEIRYGNGKFIVDENGNLTAINGNFQGKISSESGYIGGWNIGKNSLYHDGYTVGMGAFNSCVDIEGEIDEDAQYGIQTKIKISDKDSETGFKETYKAVAFWAGGNASTSDYTEIFNPKFFVSHDGYLKTAEASIGAGNNPIFIGADINKQESAIYSFKKNSFFEAKEQNGFYLGESGIAIGTHSITQLDGTMVKYNAFEVDKEGSLVARRGYIGDGENGWTILATSLSHNGKTKMFAGMNKTYDAEDGYTDGAYLGTMGLELGKAQMKITYLDSATESETSETTAEKYKQVYVPGFWVRAGMEISDSIDGQVGINRGYIAGSWRISEKGIVSCSMASAYRNKYLGESLADTSTSQASSEIPEPTQEADGKYYLKVDENLSVQLSQNNYAVQLLSFHLPNQIGRSVGLWKDTADPVYAYQRIVAGKYKTTQVDQFKKLNAKEWAWELLDDGSMYARRAVISTNREKTATDEEHDGVYIGPEGINVGKLFAIDETGTIKRGGKDYYYTTGIKFTSSGFVLSFSNGTGSKTYTNTFTVSSDSEGKITRIYNKDTEKAIDVTYAG